MKNPFKYILIVIFILSPLTKLYAEDGVERVKAKVLSHEIVDCDNQMEDQEYRCVKYRLEILEGNSQGEHVDTKISIFNNEESLFKDKAKVYVSYSQDVENEYVWSIEGYSREVGILALVIFFFLAILLVNGKQGLGATLGLILTFIIIYAFTVPMVIRGWNIFLVGIITILAILLTSFFSHGFNRKTMIALLSMLIGVFTVFVMGLIVMKVLHVNGVGEESVTILYDYLDGNIRIHNILLFSIVLGAVGVLDDVAIGQVSSMCEMIKLNPSISFVELFKKSMNIGKDHVASMINTLFIAYASSSLAVVIVLAINNPSFIDLVNMDYISEEIVRTLVASIGIVLVVPLTSLIGASMLTGTKKV